MCKIHLYYQQTKTGGAFKSIGSRVVNSIESIQEAINSVGGQNITAQYAVNTYKLEYMTLDSANRWLKCQV